MITFFLYLTRTVGAKMFVSSNRGRGDELNFFLFPRKGEYLKHHLPDTFLSCNQGDARRTISGNRFRDGTAKIMPVDRPHYSDNQKKC